MGVAGNRRGLGRSCNLLFVFVWKPQPIDLAAHLHCSPYLGFLAPASSRHLEHILSSRIYEELCPRGVEEIGALCSEEYGVVDSLVAQSALCCHHRRRRTQQHRQLFQWRGVLHFNKKNQTRLELTICNEHGRDEKLNRWHNGIWSKIFGGHACKLHIFTCIYYL